MRMIEKEFRIPVYDVALLVCACDDPVKRRIRYSKTLGEYDGGDFSGLCSWNGKGSFAVFIKSECVDINTISHEVFHLTHRIMEFCSCNFDEDHHEQGAYLMGYLMDLICKTLKVKNGR